jgi:RNA polymerase sigma-70 factor (ECF subfamily)
MVTDFCCHSGPRVAFWEGTVPDPGDSDLVGALRRGEPRAFDLVYARFKAPIYRFLLALAGRRDDADDLFQETFLRLARFGPSLREDTDLAAWLFTVARNAYRSHRRWAMLDVSRLVTLGNASRSREARATSALEAAEHAQELRRLEGALGRLPASSREALLLVGVEGFEQERAAAVVGVTYAAFRQRLARARGQLAREIERDERRPDRHEESEHVLRQT